MEKIEKLNDLYLKSKDMGLAKNQGEFARLLSTDQSTLSHCLHGDDKYTKTIDTLIRRAENLLTIAIGSSQNDDNKDNMDPNTAILALIRQMDKQTEIHAKEMERSQDQIDRLIAIIENKRGEVSTQYSTAKSDNLAAV